MEWPSNPQEIYEEESESAQQLTRILGMGIVFVWFWRIMKGGEAILFHALTESKRVVLVLISAVRSFVGGREGGREGRREEEGRQCDQQQVKQLRNALRTSLEAERHERAMRSLTT